MTVAIAVQPADGSGAVIASDGLTFPDPPTIDAWEIGSKVHLAAETPWQGAWFSFWRQPGGRMPLPDDLDAAAAVAWGMTRDVCHFNRPAFPAQPQVFIAGTGLDGTVRLGHLTTGSREWAPAEGAVYIAGLPAVPAVGMMFEQPPVPSTLQDAVALAVGMCHQFIRAWFERSGMRDMRDYLNAGTMPPVAEPVYAAVVEPGRVRLEENW